MSTPEKPKLTVIHGGSARAAISHAMLMELMQPRALDTALLAALKAQLEPRGQLHLVTRDGAVSKPADSFLAGVRPDGRTTGE